MVALWICARFLFRKSALLKVNLVLLAVLLGAVSGAENIAIQFDGTLFRVMGWKAASQPADGWGSVLRVYAVEAGAGDVQPMLGSYAVLNRELTFRPRFPMAAGVRYHAIFEARGENRIEANFDGRPNPTNPLARVDRIYPTADILPSNALRFYIYFSAPMSRGEAWQRIHLIDVDSSREVAAPFLELEQELWDQSNQRLTVLFDPGRIKRGLVPTMTIGPAIVEGRRYRLVIDREWHDARGVRLVEGFEKAVRGGPSDRTPPTPKNWRVATPKSATRDPLVVSFQKPMDYVLLQRMIGIFTVDGREVAGTITVADNETQWNFTPSEPWKAGDYKITADNTLEDIAGNHLDRPFDVDIFETVTKHIDTSSTSVKFSIR